MSSQFLMVLSASGSHSIMKIQQERTFQSKTSITALTDEHTSTLTSWYIAINSAFYPPWDYKMSVGRQAE